MRVLILVPPADYAAQWRWAFEPQAQALRDAGLGVTNAPWNEPGDLTSHDLVMPLVAWGYHQRYSDWLKLLDHLAKEGVAVENPVDVLRWNSDKAYLAELGASGVSTVPTLAFASLSEDALARAREEFGCSELVIKPAVSASAYLTFRLGPTDPLPDQVRGSRMLLQPWLEQIVDSGEYSLMFFGGEFSHAVSKVPQAGEFRVQPEYGGIITRCDPPEGALELAQAALAHAPAPTTYARVDIVVGNDGALQVIEVELIEPALFLAQAPEGASAFAKAVVSAAERAGEKPLADR